VDDDNRKRKTNEILLIFEVTVNREKKVKLSRCQL